MRHPGEAKLALYAGGDLGLPAQWRVRVHTVHCAKCREEVAAFQGTAERLREIITTMIASYSVQHAVGPSGLAEPH